MLTVPEAAERTGRNPETIRRWIREGKLASRKVGMQHLIEPGDLAALISGSGERAAETAAAYARPEDGPGRVEAYPNQWLPAIVGRLVRTADPVKIVLFGPRATVTGATDADYEILVILDEVADRRVVAGELRASFKDIPAPAAIFVVSAIEAVHGRKGTNQRAMAKGRVVYTRDAVPQATNLQRLIDSGRVSPPRNPNGTALPAVWPATSGISATESLLAERQQDPR